MNEYYVSKLISVFLGLSILISSSIFVFSELFWEGGEQKNVKETNIQDSKTDLYIKNAFVESPTTLPNYYSTVSLNDEFRPTGNLTDDLASYMAREIIKTNPNGPELDKSGNKAITIPDIENISTNFATSVISRVKLLDWDEEYNVFMSKIKIEDSDKHLNDYYIAFESAFNEYLKLNNVLEESKDLNDAEIKSDMGYQIVNNVLDSMSKVVVPKKIENFHKSFVKILIYQKNLFKDGEKLKIDPLYVVYNFKKNEYKYLKALNELDQNSQEIISLNNFKKNSFFINYAYAFAWPQIVIDLKAFAQRAAEWFKQNWKKFLLSNLKDQLIHRMTQQVIYWIQGGGKPQFITDWKEFLGGAVSRGIGKALYEIYPRICEPFRPLIQIAFQPVNIYEEYVACTLGDIVRNLENFYNDFKYGSWISYGSILRPENNFYGMLLIARDIAISKAAEEKEAEKGSAESGKGFLSSKTCNEKRTPIPKEMALSLPSIPGVDIRCDSSGNCVSITCDEKITTPGGFISDTVSQVIGTAPMHRIVNAEDVGALVSAIMNSALMKLIKLGQGGLAGLLNKVGEIGKEDLPPGAISDIEDACYGAVPGTQEYNDCRAITGSSIYDRPASAEDHASSIEVARIELDQLQRSFDATREWLEIAPDIQSKLEIIGGCNSGAPLCQNFAQKACLLYDKIETMKSEMEKNINFIQSSIDYVKNSIQRLNPETSEQMLSMNEINQINDQIKRHGEIVSSFKPQEKISNLKELESAINQNISGEPQCSVSLPNL